MILKFLRIITLITSFVFLSGFVQLASLFGPGVTIVSTGNFYKAGAQFLIDSEVKKKTGKNSLAYLTEEVTKQDKKNQFDKEFKQMLEKRIAVAIKKIDEQNNYKKENDDLIRLVEKRISIFQKELNLENINQ